MIEKRCAIYTRKSHVEGLDQEYNSLDAQHDACTSYIKSQTHEGWKIVHKRYDDGGFSGGNLKRPALQDLLNDIHNDKVDVIVVYKIDRLTRSLMDFSNIIDILDKSEASFVSVTQHFNTTTSMGRLTLNVLLSFAQFEREVTGERIRDKIAASRKKGMWMGGARPLGYDVVNKKLVVSKKEAAVIRLIYEQYMALGTAQDVVEELSHRGINNKQWTGPDGALKGGKPFKAQGICKILQNPLYLGKMLYKDETYEGEHEAIIIQEVWDTVQEKLQNQRVIKQGRKQKKTPQLLEGIIFDASDQVMTPTYSIKKGNRRYPYYVSRNILGRRNTSNKSALRVPSVSIENLVADRVETITKSKSSDRDLILRVVQKVVVHNEFVGIEINHGETGIDMCCAEARGDEVVIKDTYALIRVRAILQKRDNKIAFVTPNGYDAIQMGKPDQVLVKNVVTAWKWRNLLDKGKYNSIPDLCRGENQTEGYVRRLLPLSFLAPDIMDSILDGRQPPSLDLKHFTISNLPLSWDEQRKLLGYIS